MTLFEIVTQDIMRDWPVGTRLEDIQFTFLVFREGVYHKHLAVGPLSVEILTTAQKKKQKLFSRNSHALSKSLDSLFARILLEDRPDTMDEFAYHQNELDQFSDTLDIARDRDSLYSIIERNSSLGDTTAHTRTGSFSSKNLCLVKTYFLK